MHPERRADVAMSAGRITTLPNEDERQTLVSQAENFLQDAVSSEDALIAQVDPSDLKNVWKKQRELAAAAGGKSIVIDPEHSLVFARREQT